MSTPAYVMWFTRYGSPHIETMSTLEDCYELDWMLEDCDTSTFDQYGCLECVEQVGVGVIPEDLYDEGFEAYKAERQRQWQARRDAGEFPSPVGVVEVQSPQKGRFGGWVEVHTSYSDDDLTAVGDMWRAAVGDRARTRLYRKATS